MEFKASFTLTRAITKSPGFGGLTEGRITETELMHMAFGHETEFETLTYMLEYIAHRVTRLDQEAKARENEWTYEKMMRVTQRLQPLIPSDEVMSSHNMMDKAMANPEFAHVRNAPDGALVEWILHEYVYNVPQKEEESPLRDADQTVHLPVLNDLGESEEDVTDDYAQGTWAQPDNHVRERGPVSNKTV